jgi:molybdate/tungstate transport system substrate-binding protein
MPRLLAAMSLASLAAAQTPNCAPPSSQHLIIYRAGSLTRAFTPLEAAFTCQTGIQVKDVAMGSVDAGRQITAGGQASDLYAPADYLDIDLFMKPAGYASFTIVFAHGRMVLAYSASGLAAKKLPPVTAANWYQVLLMPGVAIGGGNPFLDPGAYRAPMIFQLAEAYYRVPNLYNNLLEHVVVPGPADLTLGKQLDFQLTYEHNARATAAANPDYRVVNLPAEIDLSDPAKDAYYRQNAVVVLPGLGTPRSARTIAVPGAHVTWGITIMKDAPNRENAIKFLQLLLSPAGTASLKDNGPDPISPALVSPGDLPKLPESLRPLVKSMQK